MHLSIGQQFERSIVRSQRHLETGPRRPFKAMDDSQSAPPTAATGNAKSMVAAAKGRVAGPGGRRVSPGRSRRSPGRSPSPGRRSPSPDSVKFFGTGASAFQSSEPRSALFRTNTNPSFLYDYSLTVDPNSAAYRYYKTAKAAVLTKTNVPAQDTLVPRAQSPPVGTYNVRHDSTPPSVAHLSRAPALLPPIPPRFQRFHRS